MNPDPNTALIWMRFLQFLLLNEEAEFFSRSRFHLSADTNFVTHLWFESKIGVTWAKTIPGTGYINLFELLHNELRYD